MGTVLAFSAFALVVGSLILWFQHMSRVSVPRNRSLFVAAWLGGAGLGVVALTLGAGWLGNLVAVLATLAGCFFSFTVSISRQEVAADAIRVGASLPAFTAPDEHGGSFDRASLQGSPVLIKFFRGHW